MDVRVVVGHGQEGLGKLLQEVLAPSTTTLWTLTDSSLRRVGDTPSRDYSVRELAASEGPATYVVLDDLPGRGRFVGTGAFFLKRLWVWEELLRADQAVSPAVLLATTDTAGLARRHADYALLFGGRRRCLAAAVPSRRAAHDP